MWWCFVVFTIYSITGAWRFINKIDFFWGTYKVRNEIETKRNEISENETKRNQRNGNEMKRNQRKQNEIDWYEENGRKKIEDKAKLRNKKKDNSIF